jgi:hypothetical protein
VISTLLAGALVGQTPKFEIKISDDQPYLIDGRSRLQLPKDVGNWEWMYSQEDLLGTPMRSGKWLRRIPRKPDWLLSDIDLDTKLGTEGRLNFQNLGGRYLADDHNWAGGHKTANNLRYLANRRFLAQVVAVRTQNWALATVFFQNTDESNQPVLPSNAAAR